MALSIKLCANIDSRLRALAREMNCSQHWLMCEAIRQFIESEEARRFRDNEARRLPTPETAESDAETDGDDFQLPRTGTGGRHR